MRANRIYSTNQSNSCNDVKFPCFVTTQESDAIYEKQNVSDPQGSFVQQHRCLQPNPSSNRTDSKRVKRYVF